MRWKSLPFLLALSSGLVCAQQVEEPLPEPAPHFNVVQGRDDPDAIPLEIATLLLLRTRYERESPDHPDRLFAVDRFAQRYAANRALAEEMVTAIRRVGGEIDAHLAAQKEAFCARSFSNDNAWRAAMIELGEDESEFVAAFSELRNVAGAELWEKITNEANAARQSMSVARTNYDSAVSEFGYEALFAKQCEKR